MSRLQQQAIVIGDSFNNTLGLIRSLGEAKVDIVLLLVGDDRLFVSKSRYLKKSQIFQMETIDDCLPTLLRIADKTKQQTIICTNDIATQYIDEYETTLCSLYITPMKGRHLGNLLNKDEQCRLAENCGLTIPQSIIYNRNEDFPTVSYPILMKPANSNTGEKSDIHICYCQKDVNKALSATSTCNQFIIQKFIEKEYEINLIGVSTVNGVYIPGGIRKIRHYPTIYSPCSFGVFQSVENLNVDVHSILKLMQHVGYHGPFSVELLHKNAKNYFMEVNFRHDGLAYAATASGVNLPAMLFNSQTVPMTVNNTYMMDLSTDYCHVKDGTLSRKYWFYDFRKTKCQLNFNRHDLMPTIDASPLVMECNVVDIYKSDGFDNFICSIANTYAAPEVLDGNGKLDYTRLKPVLFEFPTYSYIATGEIIGKCLNLDKQPGMCAKEPMTADGIVRLSKIEVYPQHLDEYMKYATEVGEVSLRTEPGVLTMYAVSEKENPCKVTILETYASREAYEKHIASEHFQKYKQGTLHMVKSLVLSDQTPLNPANRINNFIQ